MGWSRSALSVRKELPNIAFTRIELACEQAVGHPVGVQIDRRHNAVFRCNGGAAEEAVVVQREVQFACDRTMRVDAAFSIDQERAWFAEVLADKCRAIAVAGNLAHRRDSDRQPDALGLRSADSDGNVTARIAPGLAAGVRRNGRGERIGELQKLGKAAAQRSVLVDDRDEAILERFEIRMSLEDACKGSLRARSDELPAVQVLGKPPANPSVRGMIVR